MDLNSASFGESDIMMTSSPSTPPLKSHKMVKVEETKSNSEVTEVKKRGGKKIKQPVPPVVARQSCTDLVQKELTPD